MEALAHERGRKIVALESEILTLKKTIAARDHRIETMEADLATERRNIEALKRTVAELQEALTGREVFTR